MKNFFLMLLLSSFSLSVSAATLNINESHTEFSTKQNVTSSQPSLPTSFAIGFDINTFEYALNNFDIWETHPNGGESQVTFSEYALLDSDNNVVSSAVLAGLSAFSFAYNTLADTSYTLELFGTLGSSPTRVHLAGVAQTPIPAALWLFGPLMIGLLAFRKRFTQ